MAKVEKVEKDSSKLDKLPVPVQALIGAASLLGITAVGFGVFFAVDILILDFDPIGKLISLIF